MSKPLTSVPQRAEIWHGSLRPHEDADGPQRRIAWIDEDGQVRSLFYLPAGDDPADSVWAALVAAILQPREGRRRRPEYAILPDQGLVEALRDRARQAGIELCYQPDLPPAFLSQRAASLSYRCDPSLVAEFFEAASSFTLEATWCAWEPDEILVLEGLDHEPLYGTLLGSDGADPPGLALFRSLGALREFLDHQEPHGLAAWLSLESPTAVGPQLMAEIAENGWSLPTFTHVPVAIAKDGELAGPEELRLLTRALEAVERYSEDDHGGKPLPRVLSDGTKVTLRVETLVPV